jgi:hypothetical protein
MRRIAPNDNVGAILVIAHDGPHWMQCDVIIASNDDVAGEYKIRPYAYHTSMPASPSSAAIPACQSS